MTEILEWYIYKQITCSVGQQKWACLHLQYNMNKTAVPASTLDNRGSHTLQHRSVYKTILWKVTSQGANWRKIHTGHYLFYWHILVWMWPFKEWMKERKKEKRREIERQ